MNPNEEMGSKINEVLDKMRLEVKERIKSKENKKAKVTQKKKRCQGEGTFFDTVCFD